MERSGRITRLGMRWYSMAGMMAMSAAPVRSASAQSDGTVKERSYLPWSGPWVKPRTSGAVFRYCTTEMRSLFTLGWLAEIDYSRGEARIRKGHTRPFDVPDRL